MMGLTWLLLGIFTAGAVILYRELSHRYHLNWLLLSGYGGGIALLLFSIAWSVGAVLEGVPRSGSMGMLLFGLPGIIVLTLALRGIFSRPERESPTGDRAAVIPEIPTTETTDFPVLSKQPQRSPLSRYGLRYAAYLSLLVAFVYSLTSGTDDFEAMIQARFPDVQLEKVNDNPVVFRVIDGKESSGEYILITEGQGYGGPFVLGLRIEEDAKVHEVIPLNDKETPAFIAKIRGTDYLAQFIGKNVADDFIVGRDIDAVTGATVTTRAATEAVRHGAHLAAVQYFDLDPDWQKVRWSFGVDEILVLLVFFLAFVPKVYRVKPWKYLYMAATIGIVGFYLNASVSVGLLSGLLMGYIPKINNHLTWWILVVGTVLTILIIGKNVYCYRICPFYGVQIFLNKISGNRWNPTPEVIKRFRNVSNVLLWLCLMIIFVSRSPAIGAFEPFAMMFSLEGVGIQWYILPLSLIGSFFMPAFWCRFFCPVDNLLSHLQKMRKFILKARTKRMNQGGSS
jgi:Na+-translocating ferredoxin:NAD+ oxidoreductase RnfG subunit